MAQPTFRTHPARQRPYLWGRVAYAGIHLAPILEMRLSLVVTRTMIGHHSFLYVRGSSCVLFFLLFFFSFFFSSCSGGKSVHIWDARDGKEKTVLAGRHRSPL